MTHRHHFLSCRCVSLIGTQGEGPEPMQIACKSMAHVLTLCRSVLFNADLCRFIWLPLLPLQEVSAGPPVPTHPAHAGPPGGGAGRNGEWAVSGKWWACVWASPCDVGVAHRGWMGVVMIGEWACPCTCNRWGYLLLTDECGCVPAVIDRLTCPCMTDGCGRVPTGCMGRDRGL